MKINTLCDLYYVYQLILDFWFDSGLFTGPTVGSDRTADFFFDSYYSLNSTMEGWRKVPGSEEMFRCSIK